MKKEEIQNIKRDLKSLVNRRKSFLPATWVPALIALLLLDLKRLALRKRKTSKYNLFVGRLLKEGKSMGEIGKLWRTRK